MSSESGIAVGDRVMITGGLARDKTGVVKYMTMDNQANVKIKVLLDKPLGKAVRISEWWCSLEWVKVLRDVREPNTAFKYRKR